MAWRKASSDALWPQKGTGAPVERQWDAEPQPRAATSSMFRASRFLAGSGT